MSKNKTNIKLQNVTTILSYAKKNIATAPSIKTNV